MPGGKAPGVLRRETYRGYRFVVLTNGAVRIWNDSDAICTEVSLTAAKAVVDGWLSAR